MTENKESLKKNENESDVIAENKSVKTDITGQTGTQREIKKERFDFVLTANDSSIICQRYFHIYKLNPKSLSSRELYDAVRRCVTMIQDDLKWKSQVYLEAIAPQVFNTMEEMENFLAQPTHYLHVTDFLYVKECNKTFTLCDDTYDKINGEYYAHMNAKVRPYDGTVNFFDTVEKDDNTPCILKFALRDNGREIISFSWDGNVYPRFIRTNIDIINRKNRFISEEDKRKTLESQLVDMMKQNRSDLTGPIVREICEACGYDDELYAYTKNNSGFGYTVNFQDNSIGFHRRPERNEKGRNGDEKVKEKA